MFFLPLCLDVLTDHFDRSSAGTQEAEALTPEHFLPELLPDLRILFFDQTAAGAFIGIDEFTGVRYTQRSLLLFRIFRRSVLFFCIL